MVERGTMLIGDSPGYVGNTFECPHSLPLPYRFQFSWSPYDQ